MIAHLTGKVLEKAPQTMVLEVQGVGYEVQIPLSTFYALPGPGEQASLRIHTHVREDALTLFGFQTLLEKHLFLMLFSVSGIGPRLAINILSGMGPHELLEAIAQGDAVRLRAIPGVGKKTAERIALELKDRATALAAENLVPVAPVPDKIEQALKQDALSALLNLGYTRNAAETAVKKAQARAGDMGLEDLIREALRILS